MNGYHELAQHLLSEGYTPEGDGVGRWIVANHRKVITAVVNDREHTWGAIQERLVDLYMAEGFENVATALKDLHSAIENEEKNVETAVCEEMERILSFRDEMKQLANEIEAAELKAA